MRRILHGLSLAIAAGSLLIQLPLAAAPADQAGTADGALTLERAIELAMRLNPEFAAARRELGAAAALREQAGLLPNPIISYDQEDVHGGRRASGVSLSQPIELGGRRQARIRAADQAGLVAQADTDLRAAELRATVIQLYFDVVAAQERERLAQGSADLARRVLDAASRRVQAGRVPPVEQTRARVAESTARIELDRAQTELAAARSRLAALWSDTVPRFDVADAGSDDLPSALTETMLVARIEQAPETIRAQAEVEQRDALTTVARTARVPNVAVSGGSRTLVETGERATVIGLTVAIPVFDRNQGNIREAMIRAEQARQRLVATDLRVGTHARQANARLAAARREVQIIRGDILPGASSALEASARGYELGRFGFLEVLDAQRTLIAARAQLVRAQTDAHRAAADLERLLGPIRERDR